MSTSLKPAIVPPTSLRGGASSPKISVRGTQTSAAIALNMSWQLLIVILVPVLGGHFLDTHYKITPLWTATGMAVAMVAMVVVIWQTVRQLSDIMKADSTEPER